MARGYVFVANVDIVYIMIFTSSERIGYLEQAGACIPFVTLRSICAGLFKDCPGVALIVLTLKLSYPIKSLECSAFRTKTFGASSAGHNRSPFRVRGHSIRNVQFAEA